MKKSYIIDTIQIIGKKIPVVSSRLILNDRMGAIKVRWNIGRNDYRIDPGVYAVGCPAESSDVFVSANYKLSFDHLRKNLDGLNAWILVLDTKGINVWCAAGKGTFGTDELVNRIRETELEQLINHRRIIVPQLGATGVSAYKVKVLTSTVLHSEVTNTNAKAVDFKSIGNNIKINQGFNVVFGPVRAVDIKAFIKNSYRSTDTMRKVTFNFSDRIKLIPVDMVHAGYKLLFTFFIVFILSGLNTKGIDFSQAIEKGLPGILYITLAFLTGIVITPALLPYIPVTMFAFKGLISGLILSVILLFFNSFGNGNMGIISWFLIISAISSFMAMNFTGASTFTSLSGVKKEMKTFVPLQVIFAVTGLTLFIISNFQ